jgi:hypothetical protein
MDCNLSLPKRSAQCNALNAREEEVEVKVLVYEDPVMTFGHRTLGKSRRATCIVVASCNSLECGKHIDIASTRQYMSGPQGNLEMWLEGENWEETLPDEMVAVPRQAFDRPMIREYADNNF